MLKSVRGLEKLRPEEKFVGRGEDLKYFPTTEVYNGDVNIITTCYWDCRIFNTRNRVERFVDYFEGKYC